ncbi:ATPase [Leptospira yasudae]|uniref:ATPase n=1 Tax=Leptospira yasudae TaxID=2202201 RepID=A0ABX9M652_9LEPT|nr:SRPBCC family protein [Leptospira yasudae]MBW0432823.1 SRPBCC domain-containing protein [Leptospira yasudae]RHX81327.1 ATPase [Leptospira yasudae]RHX96131.1 ATPase [Leptospira yasudae]TGK29948.1 ATPase [Leptospira yasudae]TGM07426.1 ATPase [Leptospira yasudae]
MSQKLILKKQISIQAPIAKVWNGLIDPEIIKLYLYGTKTISDWKVGSPIVFTGVWEEKEYKDHGTILKFEKEKIFQYNYWSNFSGIPDVPENYSIITFELKSEGTSTILTLTQENFPTQTSYEHSDTGWDHSLKILKEFLER